MLSRTVAELKGANDLLHFYSVISECSCPSISECMFCLCTISSDVTVKRGDRTIVELEDLSDMYLLNLGKCINMFSDYRQP